MTLLFANIFVVLGLLYTGCDASCVIPSILRGTWFSFERGQSTTTDINSARMSRHGTCVGLHLERSDNVTLLFEDSSCFHCVKWLCVFSQGDTLRTLDEICGRIEKNEALVTMFNENYVPKNCRSALEGVWQFAYQNRFSFTGECDQPDQKVRSCQEPGNQFLIANQKFTINYTKCEGIKESLEGDWFIGKNHYFAAANTKESRKDEKFRCFIRNRDDDIYMGVSITPECSPLKTPENSPVRFRMTPVKSKPVEPGCLLPQNFTGKWINTAHTEADITINETHITEIAYPDLGRFRKTIYVCKEQRNNLYMMARLNIDGWRWKYDLFLARDPVPVKCPVAGKFNFTQRGEKDLLLQTRILGGVTSAPWDNIYCKENISDFSVCDKDQKEIWIDVNYCITVDAYGRQVYQRADLHRVMMSQSVGPSCNLDQTVDADNMTMGAAVSLDMIVYEREHDRCPMYFDDGSNPYKSPGSDLHVFRFKDSSIKRKYF
ncbi:hypothetical protein Avbf_15531 [Armadillidium vulgare]|nr:hypothetical protein Avbf_15531 [Armadillidium vulgare]